MKQSKKQTASFIAGGERVTITMELRDVDRGAKRTVDGDAVPDGAKELSLVGVCDGASGQCVDSIRRAGGDNPLVARICDIWDRWHLNGMKAADRVQDEYLRTLPEAKTYEQHVAALKGAGLYIHNGYTYGASWLFEPLPTEIVIEAQTILKQLDGKIIGHAPDVSDAPEVGGDIIDSRDVTRRIEIYRDAVRSFGLTPGITAEELDEEALGDNFSEVVEIVEELNALTDLEDEAETCGEWRYGATLIRESYFTEYCQDLVSDIGDMPRDIPSYIVIDWEATAKNLKADYAEVSFRGETYLVR